MTEGRGASLTGTMGLPAAVCPYKYSGGVRASRKSEMSAGSGRIAAGPGCATGAMSGAAGMFDGDSAVVMACHLAVSQPAGKHVY